MISDLTTIDFTSEAGRALVRGAVDLEPTPAGLQPHRLLPASRAQIPDGQLTMVESQPSGVRVTFRTAATVVELVTTPTKRVYVGLPPRPDGSYDLMVDGVLLAQGAAPTGSTLTIDMATGSFEHAAGAPSIVRFDGLPATEKDVEIWLPHDESTALVALRTDAPATPLPDRARPVWLHHGSSISQGSNATNPTAIWPSVAARGAGVDLVNLGFGGSALLDPFTARTMRDVPADVISLKVGINLVNADVMRRRALAPAVHGFLDTIRDGHPDAPLLVVTPLYCPIHEQTPGPAMPDPEAMRDGRMAFSATGDPADVAAGRLTLEVVREVLTEVVSARSATDPALHLVDGLALFGPDDEAAHPLPDALHLDTAAHAIVGERFARILDREVSALT